MRARDWVAVVIVAAIVVFGLGALSAQQQRKQDFREWCASEGGHANWNATECRSPEGEIILRGS